MLKLLFFLSIILPFTIAAQDIKIKKENVFVNDSLYCHIDGKTSLINLAQGEMEFTISSLQGKELIFVKDAGPYYFKTIFLGDRVTIKIKKTEVATPGKNIKEFIKKMLGSHLLQADTINADAEQLFILKNDASDEIEEVGQSSQSNGSNEYEVVDRNTSAFLIVGTDNIIQDGKIICAYTSSNEAVDGAIKTTVTFYLPNGTEAAKLTADNFNAPNNSLLVLKDNKFVSLPLSGDMVANGNNNIKTTAQWLIERGYL